MPRAFSIWSMPCAKALTVFNSLGWGRTALVPLPGGFDEYGETLLQILLADEVLHVAGTQGHVVIGILR